MVPEDSACLDISETRCGLARDHFRLNKFTGPDDPEFCLVREQIKRLVENAHTRTSPVEDPQIAKLPVANGAAFDSQLWQHKHQCLEGTRVGLLEQILDWSDNPSSEPVYWLKGMAGTGKSTVARTVCHRLNRRKCLGASFFFSRGEDDLCNAARFFSTIAAQLVNTVPELKRHVSNAIAADNSRILEQGFSEQWTHLIFEPLSHLRKPSLRRIVLVIDALDECEDRQNRQESREDVGLILELLTQAKSLTTVQLRILITSRPEVAVTGSRDIYQVEFHRLPTSMVNDVDDITIFFEHELGKIKANYEQRNDGERLLPASWPSKKIVKALVNRAGGLFIYASTVCLFISYEDMHPVESLSIILEVGVEKQLPLPNLDNMYKKVLELSVSAKYNDYVKERLRRRFRLVVGSLAVLFDSVSIATLANLLAVSPEEINGTFSRLRSVLDVQKDHDSVIRLLHTSFRDFLLDHERCSDTQFWIDKAQSHAILTERCLELMGSHFRRDMAKLRVAGAQASTVTGSRLRECLPLHIQYSCRYWVSHLQLSNIELRDDGSIHVFLKKHFLHWVEALSLMQNVSEGVFMIRTLEKLLVVSLYHLHI
jgi:NACHT domain